MIKERTNCDLKVFFTVKTHKTSLPFRSIVSERGSYLEIVAEFIQKKHNSLVLVDPFIARSSSDVVADFGRLHRRRLVACSLDVDDLYYNLDVRKAMEFLEQAVLRQG